MKWKLVKESRDLCSHYKQSIRNKNKRTWRIQEKKYSILQRFNKKRQGTRVHSTQRMMQILRKVRKKTSNTSNLEDSKPLTKEELKIATKTMMEDKKRYWWDTNWILSKFQIYNRIVFWNNNSIK